MNNNKLHGETIFITGGAGFIGSALIERLINNNKVIVFDNFSRNSIKDKEYYNHDNLEIVHGDVMDIKLLKDSMKDASYVVHAAGIAGVDTVIKSPVTTMKVNMVGSTNVLEAASTLSNCKRVVCFSTSEVFGQIAFRSEETSPTVLGAVGEARWTYAVSKLAEEHLAYAYYKEKGLPTVTVRPFNVYGPGQVGEGALRTFIIKALNNEDLVIHGDGTQIRAWCYVDDMVEGILRCMTFENAIGESFNIGNSKTTTTIYGLANTVIRVLESKSKIKFITKQSADIELRIPKIVKAFDLLGFEAATNLEEGILKTADFYKEKFNDSLITTNN